VVIYFKHSRYLTGTLVFLIRRANCESNSVHRQLITNTIVTKIYNLVE